MNRVWKVNCPVCGSLIPDTDRVCSDGNCERRNERKKVFIKALQAENPSWGLLQVMAANMKLEGIVMIEYCATWGCYELRKPAPQNPAYRQSRYCTKHAAIAKKNAEFFQNATQKFTLQRERA